MILGKKSKILLRRSSILALNILQELEKSVGTIAWKGVSLLKKLIELFCSTTNVGFVGGTSSTLLEGTEERLDNTVDRCRQLRISKLNLLQVGSKWSGDPLGLGTRGGHCNLRSRSKLLHWTSWRCSAHGAHELRAWCNRGNRGWCCRRNSHRSSLDKHRLSSRYLRTELGCSTWC